MNIWEADKFILFFSFVIPGFISIKAYDLFFPSESKDSSKQIIDAVTYSSINYALLFAPILWVENTHAKENCTILYYLFYVFVLFIAPIIWVWIWKKIRETQHFQKNIPHPTQKPWDYVFGQKKPYWVIAKLKDGTEIAGRYGTNSFASSAPAEEQIYLEETWFLNEEKGFDRSKNQTAGIILLSSELISVELFHD